MTEKHIELTYHSDWKYVSNKLKEEGFILYIDQVPKNIIAGVFMFIILNETRLPEALGAGLTEKIRKLKHKVDSLK